MEPKDVSGRISHVSARASQIVQPKRVGQISLLTQTENLLNPETQDLLNPEATKLEDHASRPDLQIAEMIVASAPIAQRGISATIHSAVHLEIHQATRQENLEEPTSHVQTRESMTATVTHTVKTEFQETSLVIQALLALATRTQIVKHSLRTRF
jgi:hypothetical protein